jgi:eukaryotic-like serine/threonine-protein kinase
MSLPSVDAIKENLPDLENVSPITQGGQKIVYKASHRVHGEVVLKLILDADSSERIQREIEVATKYQFENVPKLYEWGQLDGKDVQTIFLLEQYIKGETLRSRLDRDGALPLNQGIDLLKSLLCIAVEMEKVQLVHRDIKPENIMLDDNGRLWVLDFGIARHLDKASITATENRYGPHTPGYAAPEQFRNMKNEIDIRADLFSIGIVAYEVFSGVHPFRDGARSHVDVLQRTENIKLSPLVIRGDTQGQLSRFISVLAEKYPSRRPKTAQTALDWFIALLPSIKESSW